MISRRKQKIIAIVLCLMITITGTVAQTQRAQANPAVIVAGTGICAGILVAMGYSYLTTGDVTSVFDSLPAWIKDELNANNIIANNSEMAIGTAIIGAGIVDYFNQMFGDGELPQSAFHIENFETNNIYWYGETMMRSLAEGFASSMGYGIAAGTGANNGQLAYGSPSPIYGTMNDLNSTVISLKTAPATAIQFVRAMDLGDRLSDTVENATTNSNGDLFSITRGGGYMMLWASTPIPIYNTAKTTLLGYIGTAPVSQYEFNDMMTAWAPNSDGNYSVSVPLNSNPTSNQSISAEVTLQQVLDGIDDLDAFFLGGGTITLADGTVIQGEYGANVISSTEVQQLQDILVNGETTLGGIESKIRAIQSVLSGTIAKPLAGIWEAIRGMATAIPTTLTDMWDWAKEKFEVRADDWDLNFDAFKNIPLADKFPFCIPFDFYRTIAVWSASPTDYQFTVDLETSYFEVHHTVDLSPFQVPFQFFRGFCIIFFSYILISKTRSLMKW